MNCTAPVRVGAQEGAVGSGVGENKSQPSSPQCGNPFHAIHKAIVVVGVIVVFFAFQ